VNLENRLETCEYNQVDPGERLECKRRRGKRGQGLPIAPEDILDVDGERKGEDEGMR
jgi:hypothetical protein